MLGIGRGTPQQQALAAQQQRLGQLQQVQSSPSHWAPRTTDPATGEPFDTSPSPLESPMGAASRGSAAGGGGGGMMDLSSPTGRRFGGIRGSPPLTPVRVGPAQGEADRSAPDAWGATHPAGTWRGVPASPAAPSQATVKRKRTPVEGTDECTALAAYEEVVRTCCRAQAPPEAVAHMHNLFWVMPYDPRSQEPQLVAAIERYVLPNRNLRHTVFNDAGFLARVVHVQMPMQGVTGDESGGVGGLVLVTPVGAEGYLRLSWPTLLVGPTLDELLSRSQQCVVPTFALEGRHDHEDDHEEELGKRMRSCLTLASPHAAEAEAHAQAQRAQLHAHAQAQAQAQAQAAQAQLQAHMQAQTQAHASSQFCYPMTAGETESDADVEESSMSCQD